MNLSIALLFVMVALANCHGPPPAVRAKIIRHRIKERICDGEGPDFSKVIERIKEAVEKKGVDPETIREKIKERISEHLKRHGIDPEEVKQRIQEHMKEHFKDAPAFLKVIRERLAAQNKTVPLFVKAKIIRAHIRAHVCGVSIKEQIREKICSGEGPDFSKVIERIKEAVEKKGVDPETIREKIKERIAERLEQLGVDTEKLKERVQQHMKEHLKDAPAFVKAIREHLAAHNKTVPPQLKARIIKAHIRAHVCGVSIREQIRERICSGDGSHFRKVIQHIKEAVENKNVDPETIREKIKERIAENLKQHGIDPQKVMERIREHIREHIEDAPLFVKVIRQRLAAHNKTLPPLLKLKIISAHIRAHFCHGDHGHHHHGHDHHGQSCDDHHHDHRHGHDHHDHDHDHHDHDHHDHDHHKHLRDRIRAHIQE